MKFKRLESFEELEITSLKLQAIKVNKKELKEKLSLIKQFEIPKYLKSIKEFDKENVLVLIGENEMKDSFSVFVPGNQPITPSQIRIAKAMWPCRYLIMKEESFDEKYLVKMFDLLKIKMLSSLKVEMFRNEGRRICSGGCLIGNEENVFGVEEDSDDYLGHSIFKAVEKVSQSKVGYLCTGLDAFIINEPCLSCAMVFVHGRIKRVFVLEKNNKFNDNFNDKLNENFNDNFNDKLNENFNDKLNENFNENFNDKLNSFSEQKVCYNKNTNHRYNVYFKND